MHEKNETLKEKLIIAFVQTLIFGIILAVIGYWLDHRIETYKHELGVRIEQTKLLLSSLEPIVKQRRDVYIEYQHAARQVKNDLQIYYYMADAIPEVDTWDIDIDKLKNDLGIGGGYVGSSFGGGSKQKRKEDAVSVIEELIHLRKRYESVSSDEINTRVDKFIDDVIEDLRKEVKKKNQTKTFHNYARDRLDRGFKELNQYIESALGLTSYH